MNQGLPSADNLIALQTHAPAAAAKAAHAKLRKRPEDDAQADATPAAPSDQAAPAADQTAAPADADTLIAQAAPAAAEGSASAAGGATTASGTACAGAGAPVAA